MKEIFSQVLQNLRANRLRSVLTMFGILWGIVSIVMLAALNEGFSRGNEHVLREFGRNIGIVFPGRTSLQVGGERAGRRIWLTLDDVRAIEAQSRLVRALSPELERGGLQIKSAYNGALATVAGVEPPYQEIRTLELDLGRALNWADEEQTRRVALLGADLAAQLFGARHPIAERITIDGLPYTVVGRIRKKNQDSSYSGPDNNKAFVPYAAMARDVPPSGGAPRAALSRIIVSPHDWVVRELPIHLRNRTGRVQDIDWPLGREVRHILARRHGFDLDDTQAVSMWDTSLESMLFGRIILYMGQFFGIVGLVTLGLGGIGVMNIMLIAVRERTREIGLRKALGARTALIQRQFFLEGLSLTLLSGGLGLLVAVAVCRLVNLLPLPDRFAGMIVTWQTGLLAVAVLVAIGVASATWPARRAAELPPVEALRFEM
jgi:putative ABC transport system permease protein